MNCSRHGLRARSRWVVFSHISQALCSFIYSPPQLPVKGLYYHDYVKIILNFCPNNWSVTVSLYHILHNMLSPSWGNVAIIIYTNVRYPVFPYISAAERSGASFVKKYHPGTYSFKANHWLCCENIHHWGSGCEVVRYSTQQKQNQGNRLHGVEWFVG